MPPPLPDIRALAVRQWRDYQRRTPGTYFGEGHAPLHLSDAYRLQREVVRLRQTAGDSTIGYKIGCIGPGIVEQFGMAGPIRGYLYKSEMHPSGAMLAHADYANLAIEGEMAVAIGPGETIVGAFPVIELHHFVFRGASKTLVELVANNGLNAGAVLPHDPALPLERWAGSQALTIRINGDAVASGGLWSMPGGAVEAVAWLGAHLKEWGLHLAPGDLVLTGTPLGLHPVRPGDAVAVSVDGTTFVECRIV
ncbi:hydratase [Aliidongia dinghuensis]|uniref:Hydratase n=1 Tax=Aliidongia dinghuensis TaxID=1867774 RepID=A0A8J2Z1V9_9PROT|nr:fumarylacetoacetate hydrolase family protein [Aliidongia dinghuensis]GGF47532.1 hydratase [Aliidongia dinghuensis]